MNLLIQGLVIEASEYATSDTSEGGKKFNLDVFHEKFAELILRECIDTVSDCSIEYCTRPQIVSEIKEHFGIDR